MNNNQQNDPPAAGLSLADIYFVVFRHKWKIIALTLLGLAAAVYYHQTQKPPYQSDAALMIRYVSDTRETNPAANNTEVMISTLDQLEQNIINSEMEIMHSRDLAVLVASNIGPDKILAKLDGGNDPIEAANEIEKNLHTDNDSSVIHLTFKNPDPTVVQPVLNALINAYLEKHDQVHRAVDLSDDTLNEQTATLRQNIADLDKQLRDAKAAAGPGIIDVAASQKFFADEIGRLREALFEAQADLAENQAVVNDEAILNPGPSTNDSATTNIVSSTPLPPVPPERLDEYRTALARLAFAQEKLSGYLQQGFTDENKLVKEVRDQIAAGARIKSELETNYPALAKMDVAIPETTAGAAVTSATESPAAAEYSKSKLEYISLPARINTLQSQLSEMESEADKLGGQEARISDLERRKEIQENYYKSFANALQEENLKETTGPGQNSDIPEIQAPSPPYRDFKKFQKTFYGLLVSGLVAGLGLAFLIELFLDHTIRRPVDFQTKLKTPLLLSIPDVNRQKRGGLAAANAQRQLAHKQGSSADGTTTSAKQTSLEILAWVVNRRFDSYYDALRDRLVVYFESVNSTRKPKLVAVTSTHKGAGVSTIASGLAASLSETGDGRVLLVDMNHEQGTAQQFFQGHANCKLDDALEIEKRDGAMVQENLYVVTENALSDRLPRALPKRFASLIPKLKASDYDYIIFDMPPVSPTSVTARLAGFMDTVLLVVESEKTSRQVVSQANALLAQSKANVSVVLNKTRQHIPRMLHRDFLNDV